MNLNKIELIGRVCADPQVKTFDNGRKVCNLSIATNERAYKTSNGIEVPEKTDFHNVVFKGGLAGVCEQYVTKGMELYVEGTLHYRKYTDSNNTERTIAEIIVSNMQMGAKPGGNSGQLAESAGSGGQPPVQPTPPPSQVLKDQQFADDLPF
jgi:single-strand DNA-binding protein|nr:MAG TPA: Single strand binding protein [Bacteriophage sp.]